MDIPSSGEARSWWDARRVGREEGGELPVRCPAKGSFDPYWPWDRFVDIGPYPPQYTSPYEKCGSMLGVRANMMFVPESVMRGPSPLHSGLVGPVSVTNAEWVEETMPALYRVGRVGSGDEYVRPRSPEIVDVVSAPGGWKMLEAVHALAHKEARYFGTNPKDELHNVVAKAFLSIKFGLRMRVLIDCLDDDFSRMGLAVFSTTDVRHPLLTCDPMDTRIGSESRSVAAVLVGIHVEPPPALAASGGGSWLEVNRWCCMPTMAVGCGWTTLDVLSHMPRVASGRTSWSFDGMEFAQHVQSLYQMKDMPMLVRAAVDDGRIDFGKVIPGAMTFSEYVDSDIMLEDMSRSHPMPCSMCAEINGRSVSAPVKPAGYGRGDVAESVMDAYDKEVRGIMDTVESAVSFHESRCWWIPASRSERKRSAVEADKAAARAHRLLDRALRKKENGYMDEAEELESKSVTEIKKACGNSPKKKRSR